MLCAPLDWQYAEYRESASDAVLCSVLVRNMWDIKTSAEVVLNEKLAGVKCITLNKYFIILRINKTVLDTTLVQHRNGVIKKSSNLLRM